MPKVNPQILSWARESAGLTLEDAARGIGLGGESAVARLSEMESGEREPSRPQLLKMADRYRRPLLTFYLPEPPAPAPRTHDFRTLPKRESGAEATIDALVRDVRTRQALVRGALEDAEEAEPRAFVGSVDPRSGAEGLARAIAELLGLDRAAYRQARTIEQAFRSLRDAVEEAGVYVLLIGNLGHWKTNLSPGVFRGMALADPVAPFIIINETDSKTAWPFTLLHELGHILLGQSGISGYDGEQAIERLCDDAAAKFLLGREELQELAGIPDLDDLVERIGAFANARKVSRKMVAYNMLRERLIDAALYRRLAARFDEDRAEFPRKAASGAPDYYVVRRHRIGQGLLSLVDRMVAGGALTSTKASKVLGVKPTAIGRMTEAVA
ncbi:Zn-dependent peptidase ImmA (M78 family)/transcriptional regulator with XRE-family HTH domain [Novosphingobium chloroacetimidivorans]|uniref:Zn-dependent peptidase ImmA (M78 family)/transcriptional regulator with XRE-family HTH domain n=1 Tax=Novosphingobium chloroacetimidivorans TaxID=1428314 RepID=A0A7W7NYV3_9SPHN|nr:XRE family transcriptional regulator [Novosphingobium chloroacetimidivorans]MBB4860557.1 Zn-dependent peptidase ImmA (M78 family)/transcriptional regulator with XRE-family HTH domain [Novosphingobium chloroacetimidivorans]